MLGMDLFNCRMSTLDDRRAADESGWGAEGGGRMALAQLWSNLSKGRMCSLLRLRPDTGDRGTKRSRMPKSHSKSITGQRDVRQDVMTSCLASSHVLILDSIFPRRLACRKSYTGKSQTPRLRKNAGL